MQHSSRAIDSPQSGVHTRLEAIVTKHIHTQFKKPIQAHNHEAFDIFLSEYKRRKPKTLILDSCCGTGLSTHRLAQMSPSSLVVGIDRSQNRLTKDKAAFINEQANVLLLRTNCEDFWRLCVSENIRFIKHYILYPNPYPKTEHLKRRWHGHSVFPVLNQLSSTIELRSNWLTYLEEFKIAWHLLNNKEAQLKEFTIQNEQDALTLFERKYYASGQKLYQLTVDC